MWSCQSFAFGDKKRVPRTVLLWADLSSWQIAFIAQQRILPKDRSSFQPERRRTTVWKTARQGRHAESLTYMAAPPISPKTTPLILAAPIAIVNISSLTARRKFPRDRHGGVLHAARLTLAVRSSQGVGGFCDFCVRTREPRNAKVVAFFRAGFVRKP